MFQTQIKHKAQHGGYRKKPPKNQLRSLLSLYDEINKVVKPIPQLGEQLKLNF